MSPVRHHLIRGLEQTRCSRISETSLLGSVLLYLLCCTCCDGKCQSEVSLLCCCLHHCSLSNLPGSLGKWPEETTAASTRLQPPWGMCVLQGQYQPSLSDPSIAIKVHIMGTVKGEILVSTELKQLMFLILVSSRFQLHQSVFPSKKVFYKTTYLQQGLACVQHTMKKNNWFTIRNIHHLVYKIIRIFLWHKNTLCSKC